MKSCPLAGIVVDDHQSQYSIPFLLPFQQELHPPPHPHQPHPPPPPGLLGFVTFAESLEQTSFVVPFSSLS
ncbi:hypothetical protein IJU97_01725 [bacterium]|nr:hypothetical protein [bacterium]